MTHASSVGPSSDSDLSGMDVNPAPVLPFPQIPFLDWNLFDANGGIDLNQSAEEKGLSQIAEALLQYMEEDPKNIDSEDDFQGVSTLQTCTLDILMHLPQSVFSHRQLDLFLWLLKENGINDVPSIKTMQSLNDALQKLCGIDMLAYDGTLRHKYFMNDLTQLIAQFYPEDSQNKLSKANQADCWLNDLDNNQLTPMIRISKSDFYIYEPVYLHNKMYCMPLFAKCWSFEPVTTEGQSGWAVIKKDDYEVGADLFLKNLPEIRSDAGLYGIPDPANILYWNKHNSFLFTPAGLSCAEGQKEYNVHFLSTSNLALPLEMLDGIADQLTCACREAEKNGIWAWDCELQKPVLVFPVILAMLGDNPMQSEFACHIGLRGKYFCRMCNVKGKDAKDGDQDTQMVGPAMSSDCGDDEQPASPSEAKCQGKKIVEDLEQMMKHIGNFIKTYFSEAKKVGTETKLKSMQTESGIKDTYQMHFLECLQNSFKKKCGAENCQRALDEEIARLPSNTHSPVWHIKGLDPHQDTPVEILHVVLLRFIKYFWRDLIQNQLKGKEDKKRLLEIQLSSLDVSGLGLSPLASHTLVQYAGSLTGRDFQAIAQVAPYVIYDLVPEECQNAWIALSKMVPLIWQPEIADLNAYLDMLTHEIHNFLVLEAKWTNHWFNKLKFHILAKSVHSNRHAPSHDIGNAFAQGNQVCHLLSGGLFLLKDSYMPQDLTSTLEANSMVPTIPSWPFSHRRQDWTLIGEGVSTLVASSSTVTGYLGLHDSCIQDWQCGTCICTSKTADKFYMADSMYLNNGNRCRIEDFVITQVGRVAEILQCVNSGRGMSEQADYILLQLGDVSHKIASLIGC
ncbi:hypothetical protein ARMGADRAFT_1048371 [Armillaria gallica]|uniref:Uncharacterized protein n=1 Tax=Armillaria gallica TaxID=47427 RepID=A0A2H3CL98_ARMGA|nr:hypothetical protein ARMGADRAFT_1048371 [Armillaria gallica]